LKLFIFILSLQFFLNPLNGFIELRKSPEPDPRLQYLYLNAPGRGYGMFSLFCFVAGALKEYETNKYRGLEVYFGENCDYYDKSYGNNCWEYYCKPIRLGRNPKRKIKKFNTEEYAQLAFGALKLERLELFRIIKKYINIKDAIKTKVNKFFDEHFKGHHVIAIHYRGTDKISEAPMVPYDEVTNVVQNYIDSHDLQDFKLFVATDEQPFLTYMENAYPNLIISYNASRSTDGKPLHYGRSDIKPYKQGEDAIIDCLLLSKGDILIRTSSNLSAWSSYFNPYIPVIDLSKAYWQH